MAENEDFPGPHEPHHTSPPSGDFPAGFFDDVAGHEPVPAASSSASDWAVPASTEPPPPLSEAESPHDTHRHETHPNETHPHETHPHETYHRMETVLDEPAPSFPKPTAPLPPPEEPPVGAPAFPIALGLLMIGTLVGAILLSKSQKPEPAPVVSAAPAAAPAAEPAPPSDAVAKEIGGKVDGLATALKELEAKFEKLSKPEPVDLKPVQAKLDDLAKAVAAVAPLGDKLAKLDERVGGLDEAVKSAKDDLAKLADDIKKVPAPAAAAPAPAAADTKPDDWGAALAQGADLFKAGKYKEAQEVFQKLAAADSKDARVYYYAALLNGLTTGDWQKETPKIAAKGAELEKSGATKPADVDASFAALPDTLKPWLAFFRKAAK